MSKWLIDISLEIKNGANFVVVKYTYNKNKDNIEIIISYSKFYVTYHKLRVESKISKDVHFSIELGRLICVCVCLGLELKAPLF